MLKLEEIADDFYQISDIDLRDLSKLDFWLFDLEATGLDTTVERVTQIAGMPLEAGMMREDDAFSQFVFPGEGVEMPDVVRELTGITLEMLADAPPFSEAWPSCLEAASGADVWVGQSVYEFDVPLLQTELERHGMKNELPPILDTVALATVLLGKPEGRWSTSALIDRFAVDIEGLRRHDALNDVKILGKILIPMLDLAAREHGDRLTIPADQPVKVRRHPPIRNDA